MDSKGLGLRNPSTARQGIAQQRPERERQRSRPRKQAGHMTASDKCTNLSKNTLLCGSHPHRKFAALCSTVAAAEPEKPCETGTGEVHAALDHAVRSKIKLNCYEDLQALRRRFHKVI